MSWLCTRMSLRVSSGVTNALCRREPIMALIRWTISFTGNRDRITADWWLIRFSVIGA